MTHTISIKKSACLIALVVGLLCSAAPAAAQESNETNRATVQQRIEEQKAKLHETKQKICEQRAANVTRIVAHADQQAQKHVEYFDKVATRVKEFYKNKNLNVANYDTLVANVASKRAAAVSQIEATKKLTFTCGDDNGQTKGQQLKSALQNLHQSVKAYRVSIKDLLTAVKAAAAENKPTTGGTR